MQRYSLIFGLIGVLAGLGLLLMSSLNPKPTGPQPLPKAVLDKNTGKSHQLPGTEAMFYENAQLGLRFGYPESWGEVQVEHYGRRLFLTFLPKSAISSGDPARQVFMDISRQEPEKLTTYWGDLGWYYDAGPNWENIPDVCTFAKNPSPEMPKQLKDWVDIARCSSQKTTSGISVAKLIVKSNVYIIPHTGTLFDTIIISDERIDSSFENAVEDLEKLVQSIEFIEPTE